MRNFNATEWPYIVALYNEDQTKFLKFLKKFRNCYLEKSQLSKIGWNCRALIFTFVRFLAAIANRNILHINKHQTFNSFKEIQAACLSVSKMPFYRNFAIQAATSGQLWFFVLIKLFTVKIFQLKGMETIKYMCFQFNYSEKHNHFGIILIALKNIDNHFFYGS